MTAKEIKALKVVQSADPHTGITCNGFALRYFDQPEHEYLFTSLTNTGNGACYGKKAWRAAGCILAKLKKKGLVASIFRNGVLHYRLTFEGEKAIKNIL